MWQVIQGISIPLIGTALGAMCVFLLKKDMSVMLKRALLGFAAGVMVAASVWSLLIPAMNQSSHMGRLAFIPAAVGFLLGAGCLLLLDRIIPHQHLDGKKEGLPSQLGQTQMMLLAVVLHNIPEGMAVGVVFAGACSGDDVSMTAAVILAIGIAIQNFPEGAIISMPLYAQGISKTRACLWGIASGVVEPLAAALTILASQLVLPVLPYLLSFAAGAMLYVVVEELIPEMSEGEHSNVGTILFALGFVLMMILDVALG